MGVIPSRGAMPALEAAAVLLVLCQVVALSDLFCSQALHGAPAHPSPRDVSSFLFSAPNPAMGIDRVRGSAQEGSQCQ